MPLPLIPVAIALIAAGGGGVTAGAVGASDMAEAKKIAGRAKGRYEEALARHAKQEKKTGDHLATYGRRQLEVQTTTLSDWVAWLEANERKIKKLNRTTMGGVRVTRLDLPALRRLVDQGKLLQGGIGAAVSAVVPSRPRSAVCAPWRWQEQAPQSPRCPAPQRKAPPSRGSVAARSPQAAVEWQPAGWFLPASPSPRRS